MAARVLVFLFLAVSLFPPLFAVAEDVVGVPVIVRVTNMGVSPEEAKASYEIVFRDQEGDEYSVCGFEGSAAAFFFRNLLGDGGHFYWGWKSAKVQPFPEGGLVHVFFFTANKAVAGEIEFLDEQASICMVRGVGASSSVVLRGVEGCVVATLKLCPASLE